MRGQIDSYAVSLTQDSGLYFFCRRPSANQACVVRHTGLYCILVLHLVKLLSICMWMKGTGNHSYVISTIMRLYVRRNRLIEKIKGKKKQNTRYQTPEVAACVSVEWQGIKCTGILAMFFAVSPEFKKINHYKVVSLTTTKVKMYIAASTFRTFQ